ncbi:MAG: hypothetical protein U9R19_12730, partial [Bacteroidota bacterium]|nr:hypothetical protein [Bacteroidota bacterium]
MGGFIGVTEKAILDQLEKMAKSSARNSKTAFFFSIFAICISFVSLILTNKSINSSSNWQLEQITTLDSILKTEQIIIQELQYENEILRTELDSINSK